MPLLLIVVALLAPRVVMAVLWLFTTWFQGLFATLLWPILGFILLPTTLLWYSAVQHWFGGEWSLWPLVGIVVALVMDLSPGHSYARRSRDD